jgi:hypothetical protein
MKKLYGICQGSQTVFRSANNQQCPISYLKYRGLCIHWAASDRVTSIVRYLQLPPFKSLSIFCPKPGSVKFCPGQFSSLSTHLYVFRMVYKLAGGREVVEFQLILLTNKAPTKPESGGTVSSQHQLSGKVHALDSFLQGGVAHTKQNIKTLQPIS